MHWRNSVSEATIGHIMFTLPWAAARKMARNCVKNMAGSARLQRMARSAETIETRNADLRADIARLGDPAYLEQQARECLGMVRPGEQPVVRAGEPSAC